MDLGRLRSGELITAAGAAGLFVVMFLDWFGGRSAWATMTIGRVLLVLTIALATTLVVFTLRRRAVSMAMSAATITIGVGSFTLLLVAYRVLIDEPGRNGLVSVDAGAYLGLGLLVVLLAGVWRTMADERTAAAESRRQTERVLAVRGAPRPPPAVRDPERDRPPAEG